MPGVHKFQLVAIATKFCTVFFFFKYICSTMNNVFINSYLFLLALLYDLMYIHHPQGVSYYVC